MKKLFALLAFLILHQHLHAQLGEISLASVSLGEVVVAQGGNLGTSPLPQCKPRGFSCTPVAYVFIGTGSWLIPENWLSEAIPPSLLPPGQTIIIQNTQGGECVLNVVQTIAAGATLQILPTKKLRVQQSLIFLN